MSGRIAVGDLVWEADEHRRRFRLCSPAFTLTLGVTGRRQAVVLEWRDERTKRQWVKTPAPLFAFATTLNGVPVTSLQPTNDAGALVFDGAEPETGDGILTVRFRLRHERLNLIALVTLRAFDGTAALETGFTLRNEGDEPVTVSGLDPLLLTLHCDRPLTVFTLTGGHYDEKFPPSGFTLSEHALHDDTTVQIECGSAGRSSQKDIAWFALAERDDGVVTGGLIGGLAWSGRWRGTITRKGDTLVARLGVTEVTHRLAPLSELQSPSALLLPFAGDLDDAGRQWHEFLRRFWCPPSPPDFPWVQFNSWFGWTTHIDEATLMREVDIAAELGCEVFVVDAGWYDGCDAGDFGHGLGNWTEHRGKFPNGLKAFADYVHRKGMKFGLWVEPERVDLQTELAKQHPDWFAKRDGKVIGGGRYGHLCFGNPQVVAWCKERLTHLVAAYDVDWLKWDYNIAYGLGCNDPTHGHQDGDGTYAHTLGVYAVKAFLRTKFPHLVIEGCASGGHRIDFGIVRFVHTYWLSDFTHQAANVRFHLTGAWFALPSRYLNTWVVHDGTSAAEFRSRMGGAFGLSARLAEWDAATRERARRHIAEYKRLRPFVLQRRFTLTPQAQSLRAWTVWQFHDPTSDSGAVLAFRDQSPQERFTVRLKGLDLAKRYELHNADTGETLTQTGEHLLRDGVTLTISEPGGSALWWVRGV
ncbi:Alpha-galactosidase [bacterium HR17]|uniref:Alpha-galactosidase n=1 Tax=Candidatus Fervidibacter japonicus TaxID=2035412 RepID=A0A2H5XBV6_9BACT|nr:Alpha-galactosidase [bacterium HR17]